MKRASSLRFIRPKPMGASVTPPVASSSQLAILPGAVSVAMYHLPPGGRCFVRSRPPDRLDDVHVAGAATQASRDRFTNLVVGHLSGVRMLVDEPPAGDHHPRGAEATLQGVHHMEALLNRIEDAVLLKTLDGRDLMALGHGGERRAGLDRLTVHQHHADAAVGRV